ncbi:hypothetical protein K8R43_04750 [archaeon]|nr:hypothetical protein [archaeon]
MVVNWLETCKKIGDKVQERILGEYLLEEGKEELGIGAGGDKTLVIDKEAEGIILQELSQLGISLLVITEEAGEVKLGDGEPEKIIVVDPLDGSNNTTMGIGVFSVSIAVLADRNIENTEFAYIKNLYSGDEYYATKGQGAFKNEEPIHTSTKNWIEYLTFSKTPCEWNESTEKWIKRILEARHVRSIGSSAIQQCLVAEGKAEVFLQIPEGRTLDVIAGKLIIEEAGGIITNGDGKPIKGKASIHSTCKLAAFANTQVMQKLGETQ